MDTYKTLLDQMNKELEDFSKNSQDLTAYDYENKFREITDKHDLLLFQHSMGKVPKSKNEKKTITTSFGKINVKKKDIQ